LKKANTYYLQAIKIFEDNEKLYSAAKVYHQLGRLAREKRSFIEAINYYEKASVIFEDKARLV
jgi:tetratricopeptide (TPR) repeat protein